MIYHTRLVKGETEMNLTSCDNCGIIMDKDKINFPNAYSDDGFALSTSVWDGDEFVATVPCPVCGSQIVDN